MPWWRRIWVKLTHFEYWPFHVFYFPIFFFYGYLILKYRSPFFFSSSNPNIETGGMMGESKWSIFQQIPDKYIPKTGYFQPGSKSSDILEFMAESRLEFPIICKPDIGERGWKVEKIKSEKELSQYLHAIKVPFLVQEFVDFPLELGIFYVKEPGKENGWISSIVRKGFLKVEGDGTQTVKELLRNNPRAGLQFDFQSTYYQDMLAFVPDAGQEVVVEGIGNHCRGTSFLDDNDQITPELNREIDLVAREIPEFYFGRFDLRTKSYEDLGNGRNFKILELNGAGSEPGHIYDPKNSIFKAYKDIVYHLKLLGRISNLNRKRGFMFMTLKEGISKIGEIRKYNKLSHS